VAVATTQGTRVLCSAAFRRPQAAIPAGRSAAGASPMAAPNHYHSRTQSGAASLALASLRSAAA